MKKMLSVNMILVLLALCGCTSPQENISETRFLFDTVITLTADCSEETMDGAFALCEKYDALLHTEFNGNLYKVSLALPLSQSSR